MRKKYEYIVTSSVYGERNLKLSEAVHKYCLNQDVCSKCDLKDDCPYDRPSFLDTNSKLHAASILGWHITKKEE